MELALSLESASGTGEQDDDVPSELRESHCWSALPRGWGETGWDLVAFGMSASCSGTKEPKPNWISYCKFKSSWWQF